MLHLFLGGTEIRRYCHVMAHTQNKNTHIISGHSLFVLLYVPIHKACNYRVPFQLQGYTDRKRYPFEVQIHITINLKTTSNRGSKQDG